MSTELQTQPQTQEITPMLSCMLSIDGKNQAFLAHPENVYRIISAGIRKQLGGNPISNSNENEEQKKLVRLVRLAVKGALLSFGGKILDMIFRSKDHPRPGKGDDLIEWYSDMFAQIAIAEATKGTIFIQTRGGYGQDAPIIIDQIYSIPLAASSRGGTADKGERIAAGPKDPDSTS